MSISKSAGSLESQTLPVDVSSPVDSSSSRTSSAPIESFIETRTKGAEVSIGSRLLAVPLVPSICFALVALATACNTIDLQLGEGIGAERVGLDFQVVIKLAIAAACGLIGLLGVLQSWQVRESLTSIPGLCLVFMALILVATSSVAYPSAATVSRVAAIVNLGYLLFVPTVISVLGLRTMSIAVFCGLVVYMLAAWVVFLAIPEVGVYRENLGHEIDVDRMGGLGHPNSVARVGVWAALIGLSLMRSTTKPIIRWFIPFVIILGMATVVATVSRTAMLAGVIGAVFILFDRVLSRNGLSLVLAGLALFMAASMGVFLLSGSHAVGKKLVSVGTKTGDIEELSSATGRTEIWAETIRLISQRPFTGYGLNSAPVLLENYSSHAHNMTLHVTLAGGIFAGLAVIALLIWTLIHGLPSQIPLIRGVSAFVLVSGIVEDTAVDTFASPTMLLWLAILLYPSVVHGSKVVRPPIEFDGDSLYNSAHSQPSLASN